MRHVVPSLAALLLASCGATFDIDVKSTSTIKAGGLFQQFLGNTFGDFTNIDLSQAAEFKNQGIKKDHLSSVKLSKLTITVKSPSGATLEFLDAITFFVETDGQPKVQVAKKAAIPDTATSISLDLDNVELLPYVTAPSMKLTTEATARAPSQDTTIEAVATFTLMPKVF